MAISQRIELVHGDYEALLPQLHVPQDRGIVAFVAPPPWGTALSEVEGLDLSRTTPPITQVIEQIVRQFRKRKILFAAQVYEKVNTTSMAHVQTRLDWTELRIYGINEAGRNHGILLGTKGWAP